MKFTATGCQSQTELENLHWTTLAKSWIRTGDAGQMKPIVDITNTQNFDN